MDREFRKRVNFEEDYNATETTEEKRPCTSNKQQVMDTLEAYHNVCLPRIVSSTSEGLSHQFEESEKKCLYEIKEKFRLYSRKCWDDYWKTVLQLILSGRTPTVSFNEMYRDFYRSLCQMETEPPKLTYGKDQFQISMRSWLLMNPSRPEHPEEEVVICRFWLQSRNSLSIMEQKNDGGVNAENILSQRLRLLKEEGNCHIVGVMELICSWSFCKRCIKQVAEEIKKVHNGVTKILVKSRSATTPLSFFGLDVQPFTTDCWKDLRKYLTDEANSYIGHEDPSASLISEVLNRKTSNNLSSVVHNRVMPLKSWFLFNEQLRTCNVKYITCIVCCVTFTTTRSTCLYQTNDVRDVHAEAVILLRLEAIQTEAKKRNDSIRYIRIYCTYSPCSSCITRYDSFLSRMPDLEELHLIISSVYMSNDLEVTSALDIFEKKFRHKVKLEAFRDEYWDALKEHLSEEGARDLENKSKNFEISGPIFSSWSQSPSTTPRKVRH